MSTSQWSQTWGFFISTALKFCSRESGWAGTEWPKLYTCYADDKLQGENINATQQSHTYYPTGQQRNWSTSKCR